ncbi:MAG: hypothetical protein SFV52_01895 [Saprospiraceae bacterium]|nr:hypothetical protein [Saprospiraceae bacterium]
MLLFLVVLLSCKKRKNAECAFYYWQTTLTGTEIQVQYLDSLRCKRLFIKVLDIGKDELTGTIRPYALLEVSDTRLLQNRDWAPCVFITNEVFEGMSTEKADWLAERTLVAVDDIARRMPAPYRELQIDCDWTAGTREAYFAYLDKVARGMDSLTELSATIRLHQYKFPGMTGVPPVDRGILMAYNTGDVVHFERENAIYNPRDADKYWHGRQSTYPLPLDLALPLFSWTLLYRDSVLYKIIPGIPWQDLNDSLRFGLIEQSLEVSRYRVMRETFIGGHYLRPGDLLRTEAISPELLEQIVWQAHKIHAQRVAFFHLDTAIINRFPPSLINEICAPFLQAH